jgi:hypothetical protein
MTIAERTPCSNQQDLGSSSSVAVTRADLAGSVHRVTVLYDLGGGVPDVTLVDSLSRTWVPLDIKQDSTNSEGGLHYYTNTPVTTSGNVTYTASFKIGGTPATNGAGGIIVQEVTGATTNPFDTSIGAVANTVTITPSAQPCLVLFMGINDPGATQPSLPTGFTDDSADLDFGTGHPIVRSGFQRVTSTSPLTITSTNASMVWAMTFLETNGATDVTAGPDTPAMGTDVAIASVEFNRSAGNQVRTF